ncbi:cyclase family protein [Oceanobacillus jeddahense]|uniref:Cyclase family protein n=1 Tax=Oceanobacillus jeddahense TaxID=1462527 RepID=A0ABY5JXP8_9BACI|nr:cyclase family protein [Oceanobacillus jeddahense]UUI04570.1 cyclase family protein [Oceanobacillus jeddahense]
MRRIALSYPLGVDTPRFAENPPVSMWPQFSTDRGDVFNQSFYLAINHCGTHMDGANHFNPEGKQLWENPIDTFVYESVFVADIPKSDDALITKEDLEVFSEQLASCDLIIVRTGFYKYRDDAERYGQHNPGFTKDAGDFLMQFPNIKAIGMDLPSAAGAQNVNPHGVEFHQSVLGLGRDDDRAILIIEDMKLDEDLTGVERVYALPLLLKGLDSGPCTILAELAD